MRKDDIVDVESAFRYLEEHARLEDQRSANARAQELRICLRILKDAFIRLHTALDKK